MKGAQRSIFWEHLEYLNNAPLGDGQSRAEEAGMAAEYLFSKTYRGCFRIYDSALKHRNRVVWYAFVGSFNSLNKREVFDSLELKQISVIRISVVAESPLRDLRVTGKL